MSSATDRLERHGETIKIPCLLRNPKKYNNIIVRKSALSLSTMLLYIQANKQFLTDNNWYLNTTHVLAYFSGKLRYVIIYVLMFNSNFIITVLQNYLVYRLSSLRVRISFWRLNFSSGDNIRQNVNSVVRLVEVIVAHVFFTVFCSAIVAVTSKWLILLCCHFVKLQIYSAYLAVWNDKTFTIFGILNNQFFIFV